MYLGIDGGGTKTAFLLLGADGRVLTEAMGGSAYHPAVGVAGVRAVIETGIQAILAQAGVDLNDLVYAFAGLPAYGEDPIIDPLLAREVGAVLPTGRYLLGNDMLCSWAGGLACESGISVIAGTGSIAYGEYAGRQARSGGWGELFGDEGSAFWIAREGLSAFSRMSDGRASPGPLQERFRTHFDLQQDIDLAGRLNDPASAARSELAALSRLVATAADAGDRLACGIFDRAGQELAQLVLATRQLLEVPTGVEVTVSYSGGVFHSGERILRPFREALMSHGSTYHLQEPRFSPVVGAALYAARATGFEFDPKTLAALANDLCDSTI